MRVYLRPNVQVDPLFNSWFAWNLLIPPVTAAFNTRDRHLKSMTSFVNAPAMHAAALKRNMSRKSSNSSSTHRAPAAISWCWRRR